jgi:ParB family chromosome partitioning protein
VLTLPDSVQDLVRTARLSAGHARALIGAPDAEAIALQVVKDGLSVRAVARLLRSRRHHTDFVTLQEGSSERDLAVKIQSALDDALALLPDARDGKGVLRNNHARLCELAKDWLLTRALTNVLGTPDDEESDDGGTDGAP